MSVVSDTEVTEDAIRWLRRSYRAGALFDALAAVGMAAPLLYGPTLRFDRDFRRDRPEFGYAMRTGAPLMAGWTVLLPWADRKPLEGRGVLADHCRVGDRRIDGQRHARGARRAPVGHVRRAGPHTAGRAW